MRSLEGEGTGSDDGSSGNTVLEKVLGHGARRGGEVRSLELAVSDSVDGVRDGLSERLGKNGLRDGERRVVVKHRTSHLAGNIVGRLGLRTTSVAANEVRDQRADYFA